MMNIMKNKSSFWHSLFETINKKLKPSEKVINHRILEKEIYGLAAAAFLLFIFFLIYYFSNVNSI